MHFFFLFLNLLKTLTTRTRVGRLPHSAPRTRKIPSGTIATLFSSLVTLPGASVRDIIILHRNGIVKRVCPTPFTPRCHRAVCSYSGAFIKTTMKLTVTSGHLHLASHITTFFPRLLPSSISTGLTSVAIHSLLAVASNVAPS